MRKVQLICADYEMAKNLQILSILVVTFVIFVSSQPIVNENAVEQRPSKVTLETVSAGSSKDSEQAQQTLQNSDDDDSVDRKKRFFGTHIGESEVIRKVKFGEKRKKSNEIILIGIDTFGGGFGYPGFGGGYGPFGGGGFGGGGFGGGELSNYIN